MLKLWKKISFIFFIFFTFSAPALADCWQTNDFLGSVTFNKQYPPGSLIIQYGGIRGRFVDEVSRQLEDIWNDHIYLTSPNAFEYMHMQRKINDAYADIRNGGQWWTRKWYYSLPEIKGGAPDKPILVWKGLSRDFFKFGPIYINNKFRFKLRSYSVDLTKSKKTHKWHLKIKPQLKLGLTPFIRRARLSLQFVYSHMRRKLVAIEVYTGYKVNYGPVFGIQISMLRW